MRRQSYAARVKAQQEAAKLAAAPVRHRGQGGRMNALASVLGGKEVKVYEGKGQTGTTALFQDAEKAPVVSLPDPKIMGAGYTQNAGRGMLDHELGHVIYSTSPKGITKGSLHHSVTNILEDKRIEMRHVRSQPGASAHIAALNRYFMHDNMEAAAHADTLILALQSYLLVRLASGKAPKVMSAHTQAAHDALDCHWKDEIMGNVLSLKANTKVMAKLASCCIDWVRANIEANKPEPQEPQEPQPPSPGQPQDEEPQVPQPEEGEPGSGAPAEDDGEDEGEDAGSEKEGDEGGDEGEDDTGSGAGSGEEGEGDDEDAEASQTGEAEDGQSEDPGSTPDEPGPTGGAGNGTHEDEPQTPNPAFDLSELDPNAILPEEQRMKSAADKLADEIREAQEKAVGSEDELVIKQEEEMLGDGKNREPLDPRAYEYGARANLGQRQSLDQDMGGCRTTSDAYLERGGLAINTWVSNGSFPSVENAPGLARVERCSAYVPALRAKFSGALKTRSRVDHRHGMRDGEIDPQALPFAGVSDRIFQREINLGEAMVSLTIAMDFTGSMQGPKWVAAKEALEMTMAGIDGLPNVETRVVLWGEVGTAQELKGWTERWANRRFALDGKKPDDESTNMSCCVRGASRDMLKRRNSGRRILLVVTDGDTNDYVSTILAIMRAERAGIEVYALGILRDSVLNLVQKCHGAVAVAPCQLPVVLAEQVAFAIQTCAVHAA